MKEALIEAIVIIVCLGGLELYLWMLDRAFQLEQQETWDSILEELKELNDKTPSTEGESERRI